MADNYDDYSREQLLRLLRERDRRPRFGLVWERDEIDHDLSVNNDFVALDWDAELSCGDGPQRNLIIEGDNFDALRTLRMTHAGRVKCIYIDPPYNTGNRDFIYNDRFVDKEDSYRHSKWLEFMYRRLELAKELLREDGVIFVSIDDNEVFHLGLLMEQIFGDAGSVATFIWKRRTTPDSRNLNGVSGDHEYVLCYQNGAGFRMRGRAKDLSKYTNPDGDPLGPWMSDNLTGLANAQQRPNLHYQIVHPETGLRYPPHASRGWIYGPERMAELVKMNRILWPKKPDGRPRLKRYVTDMKSAETGYSTVLDAPGNVEATKELGGMLGTKIFSFPKPVGLIAQLIEQATGPDDIVLDFFAGSGTTAHAVLKINSEDGGRRRFILISNTEAMIETPDKNLCRDVCAERVRRVIAGYDDQKGQGVAGLGGGFAYLRCRRIPAATVFRGIEHAQVWTALQLIHDMALTPYQTGLPMQAAEGARGLVIYLPKLTEAVLDALQTAIHATGQAVVYSWQPALLAQRLTDPRLAFEPIPAFLVHRFGARSSAAKRGRP
jgi:adenine-specific DNA-methyltransferase